MTTRKDRYFPRLIATLRNILRANGFKIREIATHMEVSEATVKRWFSGNGLTIARLEALCALADISFAELVDSTAEPPRPLASELTLAQEQALTENTLMSFLFFMIMSGWPPRDLHDDYGISMSLIDEQLDRLERLALIDRLQGGRVRSRIDRRIAWRRGPMRRHFEEHVKRQFVQMDFSDPHSLWTAETTKLSAMGVAKLEELQHRFRLDVQALADEDRRHSLLPRSWYINLFVSRPLDSRRFQELAEASRA